MHNTNTVLLFVIIILIIGFFFMNNVAHVGFHVGHTHNGHESMMDEHEDEMGHGHGNNNDIASYEIYPGDVVDKIASGEDIVLLDVRTPEEYAEVHIANAVLLPVQKLSQQTLRDVGLGEDAKNKEIVIYCQSGGRSKQAYDIMESLGYTNISSVSGGIVHWQEDAYPYLETGEPQSTNNQSADGGARIAFNRTSHNFGMIAKSGGVVQTNFTIRNDGTEDLEIGELSTSCGCTSAELSAETIVPGGEAQLTVFFDPNFHEEPDGEFKRTVFIPTNDPTTPEADVTITVAIAEE